MDRILVTLKYDHTIFSFSVDHFEYDFGQTSFGWALAFRGIPIVILLVIFNMEGTEPKGKTVQYLHHQIFSHHFIFDLLVHR